MIGEHFDAGKRLSRYPHEMIDENKWLAARHGLDGNLVDLPKKERVPTAALARRVLERVRELLVAALREPKVRRKTRPSKAARQRRLQSKRHRSEVKAGRRSHGGDY